MRDSYQTTLFVTIVNVVLDSPHAWGPGSVSLSLPDTRVRIRGLSAAQADSLRDTYARFLAETPQLADECGIDCLACRLDSAPDISTQELTRDGLYTPRIVRDSDALTVTGSEFEAQMNLGYSQSQSTLGVKNENELVSAPVIENFLRIFMAHRVLEKGGVLLHSAGLVIDGQAYIFVGRSNAGKTTMARKAHDCGALVLSDDINLLLPAADGYQAYAVPFTGEFGQTLDHRNTAESYPVAGIILLEQGDQLKTDCVKLSGAIAKLLVNCPFVNNDGKEMEALFYVLSTMASQLPLVSLHCRREDGIDEIMQSVRSRIG